MLALLGFIKVWLLSNCDGKCLVIYIEHREESIIILEDNVVVLAFVQLASSLARVFGLIITGHDFFTDHMLTRC